MSRLNGAICAIGDLALVLAHGREAVFAAGAVAGAYVEWDGAAWVSSGITTYCMSGITMTTEISGRAHAGSAASRLRR